MTAETIEAAALFIVAVIALVGVGLRLGMLIAPRIDRLSDGDDELDRADPDRTGHRDPGLR